MVDELVVVEQVGGDELDVADVAGFLVSIPEAQAPRRPGVPPRAMGPIPGRMLWRIQYESPTKRWMVRSFGGGCSASPGWGRLGRHRHRPMLTTHHTQSGAGGCCRRPYSRGCFGRFGRQVVQVVPDHVLEGNLVGLGLLNRVLQFLLGRVVLLDRGRSLLGLKSTPTALQGLSLAGCWPHVLEAYLRSQRAPPGPARCARSR